jgi:very-short-patch-repair endonuclease
MPQFVEVTTTTRSPRNRPGLRFHTTTNLETTRRHGLPTTTPIRTLKDLAATRPLSEVERAASEALVLKLVTNKDLVTQRGPGAKVLENLIVGPTRSHLERTFLKAVLKAGLPRPESGCPIPPFTVDFYWPSHDLVVETDGNRYHEHVLARRRDRRKDAALRARGHAVLRVPEDAIDAGVAEVAKILSRPATRTAP